ncbi:MAG TPA: glycosyltransferase family 4 protein [Rhodocyclaceae bacterium]|nr:glycosyltransferase family 4 protein [Rhodocyclaceae bacterium]
MLRVAAFTQGRDVPSARFRVHQYIPALQHLGIDMAEWPAEYGSYPPNGVLRRLAWLPRAFAERAQALMQAADADAALIQREMISTLATVEKRWKKPVVFDVDDAIWIHQRFSGVDRIARACGTVICGNTFLADHFSDFADVKIIPTAVDTLRYEPGKRSGFPLMCWSGSTSGLPYLEALEKPLREVFQVLPQAKLRVICNQPPRFENFPADKLEFVPWSRKIEVQSMQAAWVGLMPMPDTIWTRGKCSFKMLTYMSCGVPAVVSPWGMNREVLAQGEGAMGVPNDAQWAEILMYLLTSPERIAAMGEAGRATVLEHYSVDVLAVKLAEILREVANGGKRR